MSTPLTDPVPSTETEGGNGRVQQEPDVPPAQVRGSSDPKMFTEEDLEKARRQEKDKTYRRIETLQETVKRLEEQSQQREAQERARQEEQQAAANRQAEDEMSAKDLIVKREAEWRQEQNELRQQIDAERALRERETQFAGLMEFRQNLVQQYSDRIAPELLDLVQGDTPETLQQSAEDMAARTDRILAQTHEAVQNAKQQMPTARITAPASGDDTGAQRVFTSDEIRQMSMTEYAKHRQRLLGQGASGGPKNRGLFG